MKLELTSWDMLQGYATKALDRTSFRYNTTRLPAELEEFFGFGDLKNGEKRDVLLEYEGGQYIARMVRDRYSNRVTLFWKNDFAGL